MVAADSLPIFSTEDNDVARRWAKEAGILHLVDNAANSGGAEKIALFNGRIGESFLLLVCWWGWRDAKDNGLTAHRSPDAGIIARLAAHYAYNCVIPGTAQIVA